MNIIKYIYIKAHVGILRTLIRKDCLIILTIFTIISAFIFGANSSDLVTWMILNGIAFFVTIIGAIWGAFFNLSFRRVLSRSLSLIWTVIVISVILSIICNLIKDIIAIPETKILFYKVLAAMHLMFNYFLEHITIFTFYIFLIYMFKHIKKFFQSIVDQIIMAINEKKICECCCK